MKNRWSIARGAVLASLALPLLSACGGTGWKRNLVYSRSPVAIYVERQEKEDAVVAQGFSHPARVSPETLHGLLSGIRMREWSLFKGSRLEPAIEPAESAALAGPLAEALAKVGPDERVRFLIARTARPLFLGTQGTSAVVFFTSAREMQVAFDLLHDTLSEESGDPRAMVFRYDPVLLTGSRPDLEPPPGASIRPGAPPKKVHHRWLVADPEKVAPAPLTPATPAPAGVAAPGAVPAPAAPPPSVETQAETLQQKLKVLDQLLRSGTITPEEHRMAREKILLQSGR